MVRLYMSKLDTSPFDLEKDHVHYLKNVLRLQSQDYIQVFNETGEWQAQILEMTKNHGTAALVKQLRAPAPLAPIGLAFAPLKHDAQLFLLEKATELGVTDFYPIITQRSNVHRIAPDKWMKNTIEACQQCERLSPPAIHSLQPLDQFLKELGDDIDILVAKERGEARPIAQTLSNMPSGRKCIFIIGPEGGFTMEEFSALTRHPQAQFITLGPRILRAETAALAVLTCFQSLLGDWQK
jgi:16S rRNA (uracil1498-N3)-methyltransferase